MKKAYGLTVTGAALLLTATNSQANFADNLYVDVGAGPAFQENSTVKSSPFTGGDINYTTGVRATVAVGYNVCKSCAIELETGVIWNSVDSINGNTLSDYGANGDLYQVPVMANVIYKVPLKGSLKPYVGAGAGVAIGFFDGSNIPGLSYAPGGIPVHPDFNGTDAAFAYQAEVGLKYELGKHMEIGLAYKFFGTTGYNWSANNATLKTDNTLTHAIMASFDWRF